MNDNEKALLVTSAAALATAAVVASETAQQEPITMIGARGIENTSGAFRRGLVQVGLNLDMHPDVIASVISFETAGTFSPTIRPRRSDGSLLSSAVGLLQWMASTARRLGTTTNDLLAMGAEQQLFWVERYYAQWPNKLHRPIDYYLAVFAPAGIGKPLSKIIYAGGSAAYNANPNMDRDGDGNITVGDIAAAFTAKMQSDAARPRVEVPRAIELSRLQGATIAVTTTAAAVLVDRWRDHG